jgi:outer membrane protein OmpA-like peptidoglycan-associated protein
MLVWLGSVFLTLAIFSGACAAYCLVKVQWQFDLLNRYLAIKAGGQYAGDDPPLNSTMSMSDAWKTLTPLDRQIDDRDCEWPLHENASYKAAAALAALAALTLVIYLWAPVVGAWLQPAKTTGGVVDRQPPPAPRLEFRTTVFFETGLSVLPPASEQVLREAITRLQPVTGRCFLVEGHADSRASDAYNLALSRMRGDRVQSILVSVGVPFGSISLKPLGESSPVAAGSSQTAYAQNRRVDVSIVPCPKTPGT